MNNPCYRCAERVKRGYDCHVNCERYAEFFAESERRRKEKLDMFYQSEATKKRTRRIALRKNHR